LNTWQGQIIDGRYWLKALVGSGGTGRVYSAEQLQLGRRCAVKVLHESSGQPCSPQARDRFLAEAAVTARLSCPHTVSIFDFGFDTNGQPYIAMEYVAGTDLWGLVRKEGHLSDARTLRIAYQLCKSLREAHGLGIFHRNIRPRKVIVADVADQRDFVKLLDFGVAQWAQTPDAEDEEHPGLWGACTAPEQALGEEVDGRADIYAVGAIMYLLLTGVVPAKRQGALVTILGRFLAPVPPIRSVRPDSTVSKPLESLVLRCLARRPERRFQNVEDLMAAMRGVPGAGAKDSGHYAAQARIGVPRAGTR